MKTTALAFAFAATLALAACSSGNEAVDNGANEAMTNVDALSADAANDAASAEAEALGNQLNQLEEENASATEDNTVNPEDADEQNVSGM